MNMESHKVYPRTYLNRIMFSIGFEALSDQCYPSLMQFLKSTFGLSVSTERLDCIRSNEKPLKFGSKDHLMEWYISSDLIRLHLRQEAYISFIDTLVPLIETITSFLTAVGRRGSEMILEKINIIPVSLDSYDELGKNAVAIFTEPLLRDWKDESFQKDDSSLLYLSKSSEGKSNEIAVISGFIATDGLPENQASRYVLDISARLREDMAAEDVLQCAYELNDMVFDRFIHSVSEFVIKSMEEGYEKE